MGRRPARFAALLVALPIAAPAVPAELKQHTLEAFLHYAAATEERFLAEVSAPDSFLYLDTLPERERELQLARLGRGELFMERLRMREEDGEEIKAKDGIIHHWLGAVFIPGVGIDETLALVQDYDRHAEIYGDVDQSRLIDRQSGDFMIFYRFRKKKVVTVIVNTVHEVRYVRSGPDRAHSVSETTSVREVENAGKPDEREKPEGKDRGFLWRLNSYWKFLERDGGTYVECETISLTRGIPFLLRWLIAPFVNDVPRELLAATLGTTRDELVGGA